MSAKLTCALLLCGLLAASGRPVSDAAGASISLRSDASGQDICNPKISGFKAGSDEDAVACYAGNFLVKVLTEVNSGSTKTAQHVRVHLLPYLGGPKGLDALLNENIHNEACQICYMSDWGTVAQLRNLRLSLSESQTNAYDDLKACYHIMTHRIMEMLPTDSAGEYLISQMKAGGNPESAAYDQALDLLKDLFSTKKYDVASCKI